MNRLIGMVVAALVVVPATGSRPAAACTNFLVSRGASADGSTMISYAADSHELYGELVILPAADYPPGTMVTVYEWDTGKRLSEIPQVRHTWRVVGHINEHQVSIGETTWGGRKELQGSGKIDYGSLMFLALQRARTAREAIGVITSLVDKYGYASSGETLSVADPREAWLLEIIGKGKQDPGAVWVACRVPDGYVSAHANQARIRKFLKRRDTTCRWSKDVISFARRQGYFQGRDSEFSFADAYAPLDFTALRICEARVWSFFRRVAPRRAGRYLKYVMGDSQAPRLPPWIRPEHKLTVQEMMQLMRDHFEDSPMDLHRGVGAGPYQLPYRWRPLTWKVDGQEYFNERATSTQQTGFSFIAQMRAQMPGDIGGVLWFGVDDTASTVYLPMYAGIRHAPRPFAPGTADFEHFSWDSAFWVFNAVANLAYGRYRDMIEDIRVVQRQLEGGLLARQAEVERAALALHRQAPGLARDYLTRYLDEQAGLVLERWRRLWQELFVKYLDGNVRDELGKVTHPGYPEAWYRRIVKERGQHYRVRQLPEEKLRQQQQKQKQKKQRPAGCPPCQPAQSH
ncbi:MAG: dipeptidase [Deltaproteobacteria bacterium]|nr:MAG: dipeptidase [Deltaproteobacteria bacterium]